jgi:MFS family permease
MFKKEELKHLWKFYFIDFAEHLFGLGALIWTVYFVGKGFTFAEVGLALAIFSAAIFIFEVPTGIIADVFGRKKSMSLSFFLIAILSLLAPFVSNFIQLCSLYIVWGVALTLSSGADEALVIDYLKDKRRKDLIDNYYTKSASINQLGIFLSGLLLTGLLFVLNNSLNFSSYDKIWFFQAGGMFLVGSIALTIDEKIRRHNNKKITFLDTLHFSKSGFSYVKNHKKLLRIFIGLAIMSFAASIWYFAYQPFLLNSGFEIKDFGWLRSLVSVGGVIFPFFSAYLMKKVKNRYNLISGLFLFKFIFMASVLFVFGPLFGTIFYFVMSGFSFILFPILNPTIQRYIPSEKRATIGSIKNMFFSVGEIIPLLFVGLLVDLIGTNLTIFISGLFIIPLIWIFYKLGKE